VVDAQRGEFYLADYQLTDDGCEPAQPLAIESRGEIERRLAEGMTVFSPDAADTGMAGLRELYPDAARLAVLAAVCGEFVPAEVLEPIYLRATSFVKAPKPDRVY
jgi:tRNA A37 threonylcarbamoyladenosine modification protein TsaB